MLNIENLQNEVSSCVDSYIEDYFNDLISELSPLISSIAPTFLNYFSVAIDEDILYYMVSRYFGAKIH